MSRRTGKTDRPPRGFTLVEALIAMAVFSLGLSALIPLVVGQVRANDSAAVRTGAVALAQETVERFRSLPYEDPVGPPYDDIVHLANGSRTQGVYTVAWRVDDAPTDPADMKRITVTVVWALRGGPQSEVALVTSRARY